MLIKPVPTNSLFFKGCNYIMNGSTKLAL